MIREGKTDLLLKLLEAGLRGWMMKEVGLHPEKSTSQEEMRCRCPVRGGERGPWKINQGVLNSQTLSRGRFCLCN